MKKTILSILSAFVAVAVSSVLAWAVLVGTTGTEKRFQESGVRVGVLDCLTRSATATTGAATINATVRSPSACGTVTTESLTTAAGSDYTLTLTNNLVASTDIVFASVQNGTNTGGAPVLRTIAPGTGSVVFIVRNGQSVVDTSLAGTLKINFFIIKQSALDSD